MTGDFPLHAASTMGDIGVVRSLLEAGAEKDERDLTGRAPLHVAAEHGHLSVTCALLAAGAAVNALGFDDDMSALFLACRKGHTAVAKALIQHEADVGACSLRHPHTALHGAAMGNHPQCITALVDAGADIEVPGFQRPCSQTPLQCAAGIGSTEAVSALLRRGAAKDASASRYGRQTPLHLAIGGRHVGVVEVLLSAGVGSPSDGRGEGYVNLAASTGDVDVLKALIHHGADVNAVSSSGRRSALHTAAACNNVGTIHVLVEAGADLEALDAEGKTPLHYARTYSAEAMVALLQLGCDKDKADRDGQTPLHMTAREGLSISVVALLAAGADVEARCGFAEDSALDLAACMENLAVAEFIVQHGADVNAANFAGETALHKAASVNKVGSVVALIGMGAAVDAQDNTGCTPLIKVIEHEGDTHETMLALLQHGADVDKQDEDLNSPLHWVVMSAVEADDLVRDLELLLEWDADETVVDVDCRTAMNMIEDRDFPAHDLSYDDDADDERFFSSELTERVRDMFARAPAERRNRTWRRRRLLVLWRAHPDRFQLIEGARGDPAGDTVSRTLRSHVVKDGAEAAGVVGQDGSGGGLDGALVARVAGLEEKWIFRSVVMYL